jgi:deoxyadenosine/deoxycytidine kinase
MEKSDVVIGIVGPCASGKSTLINGLRKYGYYGKHIAQEHSYVPNMWKRITDPDILVFLDVSYEETKNRKKLHWSEHEYEVQVKRLEHARSNAAIIIDTDVCSPNDVLSIVLNFIRDQKANV